ncbi:MAG: TusE/DsrC/DsvC family sulfur relay protein [Hyphomicrobiaceae bacterium]
MSDIDINKVLAAGETAVDPARLSREAELKVWSRAAAEAMAKADGLALTNDHWKVIEMLQTLYVERGRAPKARLISGILNDEFEEEGGSKYLYRLFPGGPVAQGSRLAGVPAPHDTRDPSFGSTF